VRWPGPPPLGRRLSAAGHAVPVFHRGKLREVYELEGDTLRVCYPLRGGPRPTALKTGPGSGLSLVVYRRG
jgi:hypothetical protein